MLLIDWFVQVYQGVRDLPPAGPPIPSSTRRPGSSSSRHKATNNIKINNNTLTTVSVQDIFRMFKYVFSPLFVDLLNIYPTNKISILLSFPFSPLEN